MNLATRDRSTLVRESAGARAIAIVVDSRHAGCAIAQHLAREGFAVVLGHTTRHADEAARSVGAIGRAGGHAIAVSIDDGEAGIAHLLDRAEDTFGHVDVLIDNGRGELASRSSEDDLFDRYFGAALRGMVDSVRTAAPRLRNGGSIVHLSDARTDHPMQTMAWMTPQAALEWLLRTFIAELARYGVRVNAIAPSASCAEAAIADAVVLLAGQDGDNCNGQVFDLGAAVCRAIGASA